MTDAFQLARSLVLVVDNNAARLGVRVIEQLRDRVDGRAGNADIGQHLVPVRNGLLPQRRLDMTEGFLAVRNAIRIGPEFRIIDDRVQSRDRAEFAPEIVVGDPDHDRTIGCLESLIGAERFMARTAFRRLHAALPEGLEIIAQ